MADLKCEYPEGCRLDLWAKVIKAKYIERQKKVLDIYECIPYFDGVMMPVSVIDDFKINVLRAEEVLNFNKVRICIEFEVILFIPIEGRWYVYTTEPYIYEQTIDLDQFDPPLSVEEFRSEIDQSEILLCNWSFDYEVMGLCEDRNSPCDHHDDHDHHDHRHIPDCDRGTCVKLVVYVDIIDKLGKMHDIIVYGELDPEIEC